jgi:hypothetical protein
MKSAVTSVEATERESVSAGTIALAAARDTIPVASSAASWLFDTSESVASFGFRAGDTLTGLWQASSAAGVVGTAALGAAGVFSAPVAIGVGALAASGVAAATVTRWGLARASDATRAGLSIGRSATHAALETSEALLEAYGIEAGATLRLAFGRDAAAALVFVQALLLDVGVSPPAGMSWQQTAEAARALAWLQAAAGAAEGLQRPLPSAAPACPGNVDRAPSDVDWARLRRFMRLSLGCYGHVVLRVLRILPAWTSEGDEGWTDLRALAALSGGTLDTARDVVLADWKSDLYKPGHLLLVDRPSACLVLAVRGTVRLQDALTDLVCEHARFETATHGPCTQGEGTRADEGEGATIGATMEGQPMVGEAHAGMLKAAERLLAALRPTIEKTLLELPTVHELCLCGHSLGGGLAALMAVLIGPTLRVARPDGLTTRDVRVRAYAFGPPAVLSLELARAAAPLVTSVVEGVDLVPRFGLTTTRDLREALGWLHDEDGLLERIAAKRNALADGGSETGSAAGVGAVVGAEERAWARSLLDWLRAQAHAARPSRLYPPGRILWRPAAVGGAPGLAWCVADPSEFDSILLVGSQMLTSHVPSAYARALLGELPLQTSHTADPDASVLF